MTTLPMNKSAPPLWKQILRTNFVDVAKLADFLELTAEQRRRLEHRPRFALNLPMRLAEKITKRTLNDPLLKQFLPVDDENIPMSSFSSDPVGDSACRKGQKLLSKYHGRVLLIATSACAMHCRFCFRQHFDYDVADKLFEQELQIIAEDPSINEVILSGGDPLSLDDKVLGGLIDRIAAIPHVRKLRFHTRFPVGIPERIDADFLDILRRCRLQMWFVVHTNHAMELDEDIYQALKSIQRLGIPVITQTVLLEGVNDDVDILAKLCSDLVDNGIMPYYLHQLDRVQGAVHFEVPEERGRGLIRELAKRLPGYAVPRYVKEIPGQPNKTFI